MDILEHFYNHPPRNDTFAERSVSWPALGDINLYGPRGCGKTALILERIKHADKTLYIDLESPTLIITPLETLPLQAFIDEYDIDELVLDHYEEGMMETFPEVKRLVVVSRSPLHDSRFSRLKLEPLSYEEFLAFQPSTSAVLAFNRFLRTGSLPATARQLKSVQLTMKRFFQHQFSPNEQALILMLARYNAQPLTVHQIYTFTREYFKISKDTVYETIARFRDEGIVHIIDNAVKRSGKKTFLYDFAFAKYLAPDLSFGAQFETLTVLSMRKKGIRCKTLGLHEFVTENGALIAPAPFESEEQAWAKAQKRFGYYKEHGIREVLFVTVSNAYAFDIGDIRFRALPFYEWSRQTLDGLDVTG
jgi:predicted AAA+ superfamily ATPase